MSNKSTDPSKGGAGTAQSGAGGPSQAEQEARAAAEQAERDRIAADEADAKKKKDEEDAAAEAAKQNAADAGLVAMTKNGETLKVHPSCVNSHISAGWKVAE